MAEPALFGVEEMPAGLPKARPLGELDAERTESVSL